MKSTFLHWLAAFTLSASPLSAVAHGDEPHGDEPHPAGSAAPAGPRFEAATETFEMVGRLENGSLTLFINRFETNEPVLHAKVELESGAHKAVAAYRAEQGSYVVSEPKFVSELSKPGAYPVLVTLSAGNESDLLEATLNMASAAAVDEHEQNSTPVVALAGTLGLGVLGAGVWTVRKRRTGRGDRA